MPVFITVIPDTRHYLICKLLIKPHWWDSIFPQWMWKPATTSQAWGELVWRRSSVNWPFKLYIYISQLQTGGWDLSHSSVIPELWVPVPGFETSLLFSFRTLTTGKTGYFVFMNLVFISPMRGHTLWEQEGCFPTASKTPGTEWAPNKCLLSEWQSEVYCLVPKKLLDIEGGNCLPESEGKYERHTEWFKAQTRVHTADNILCPSDLLKAP